MALSVWYHGTTAEGYSSIIASGKLKAGTYFTPYFDTAMCMGGSYVFGVILERPSNAYWEWVSDREFMLSEIHSIRKISVELLKYNKYQNKRFTEANIDNSSTLCEKCEGHGELSYLDDGHWLIPGGAAFKQSKKVISCDVCNGYGYIKET